jgi:phosphatidate phosphatase APP1
VDDLFVIWRFLMTLPIVTLLLTTLIAPALSAAQDATGRLFGTVHDQQQAVIPGVQIVVTNTATQAERNTATDTEGYFQILALRCASQDARRKTV